MFSKIIVAFSALVVLATAMPTPGGSSVSQCNASGYARCCNTVTEFNSTAATSTSSILNVVLTSVDALVGLDCSVLNIGDTCSNTAVCCSGSEGNGLINVGCIPIIV